MFGEITGKGAAPTSPAPSIKPDTGVDIGQNTIIEPEPTDSLKNEEVVQEKEENDVIAAEEPDKQEESDQISEQEDVSTNSDVESMGGESMEEKPEEEQMPEENAEGDQQMENESNVGGTSVSITGGGGGVVIGGDAGGMGNMDGTMSETAAIQSPLTSIPFMLEITGITAVLAIIIGVLLAVRKIKKGFELYED